jgi:hypothetical protein
MAVDWPRTIVLNTPSSFLLRLFLRFRLNSLWEIVILKKSEIEPQFIFLISYARTRDISVLNPNYILRLILPALLMFYSNKIFNWFTIMRVSCGGFGWTQPSWYRRMQKLYLDDVGMAAPMHYFLIRTLWCSFCPA